MSKETREEKNFWGETVKGVYEGGKRVGETRTETTFLGDSREVHYQKEAGVFGGYTKVGHSQQENTVLGDSRSVHYDSSGRAVGESRESTTFLGDPQTEVYSYDDGSKQRVGTWKEGTPMPWDPSYSKKVLEERRGTNLDPLTGRVRVIVSPIERTSVVHRSNSYPTTCSRSYGASNTQQPTSTSESSPATGLVLVLLGTLALYSLLSSPTPAPEVPQVKNIEQYHVQRWDSSSSLEKKVQGNLQKGGKTVGNINDYVIERWNNN